MLLSFQLLPFTRILRQIKKIELVFEIEEIDTVWRERPNSTAVCSDMCVLRFKEPL